MVFGPISFDLEGSYLKILFTLGIDNDDSTLPSRTLNDINSVASFMLGLPWQYSGSFDSTIPVKFSIEGLDFPYVMVVFWDDNVFDGGKFSAQLDLDFRSVATELLESLNWIQTVLQDATQVPHLPIQL